MPNPFKGGGSGTMFVSAECPDIRNYWFLGDAIAATLTGMFVNDKGDQIGMGVSLAIPVQSAGVTSPVNLATLAATFFLANDATNTMGGLHTDSLTLNPDAVGFVGNLSANARFSTAPFNSQVSGRTTAFNNDFKANPSRYPLMTSTNTVIIGSVAKV